MWPTQELLRGEVDHADKQEAMQLSTPCDHRLKAMGKAIFDGRLAHGLWALVEQVEHDSCNGQLHRFCCRFPKRKKHREERVRSHCCHTHSSDHVNVYSLTTWENGKSREHLSVQLFELHHSGPGAAARHCEAVPQRLLEAEQLIVPILCFEVCLA